MAKGKHGKNTQRSFRRLFIPLVVAVLIACCAGLAIGGGFFDLNKASSDGEKPSVESANEKNVSVSGVVVECEDGCAISLDEAVSFSDGANNSEKANMLYFADGTVANAASYLGYPVDARVDVSSIENGDVYVTLLSIEPSLSKIAMEYGSFAYPTRWNDSIDMEMEESENGLSYTFYCVDFEKKTPLFVISFFAQQEEGIVGVIETESGELFVCADQKEEPKGLSEEESKQFNAMLDDMNYLIFETEYDEGVKLVG